MGVLIRSFRTTKTSQLTRPLAGWTSSAEFSWGRGVVSARRVWDGEVAQAQYQYLSTQTWYPVGVPRAGQPKPEDGRRLRDRIALGMLTATYPQELVDQVLESSGRRELRYRLLPARMVVY